MPAACESWVKMSRFLGIPTALILASLLAWTGPRALWSQSWRAHTQVTFASLPTCAAAQAAGRAWAAELRAGGIDVRTALWSTGARGAHVWDFLPPSWKTDEVKTYGATSDGGWDGTKRLFGLAQLASPLPAAAAAPEEVAAGLLPRPHRCVIYSFGSNLQTEFEESMLRVTACNIFTFDCTVRTDAMAAKMAAVVNAFVIERSGAEDMSGSMQGGASDGAAGATSAAAARFSFLPYCVGKEGQRIAMRVGGQPGSTVLRSVPAIMAELGHLRIDLLKMDAEGAEHFALAEVVQLGPAALPPQVNFELHTHGAQGVGLGPRFAVVAALIDAGYVLVARDDNLVEPGCCSEVTFVRGCSGIVH